MHRSILRYPPTSQGYHKISFRIFGEEMPLRIPWDILQFIKDILGYPPGYPEISQDTLEDSSGSPRYPSEILRKSILMDILQDTQDYSRIPSKIPRDITRYPLGYLGKRCPWESHRISYNPWKKSWDIFQDPHRYLRIPLRILRKSQSIVQKSSENLMISAWIGQDFLKDILQASKGILHGTLKVMTENPSGSSGISFDVLWHL